MKRSYKPTLILALTASLLLLILLVACRDGADDSQDKVEPADPALPEAVKPTSTPETAITSTSVSDGVVADLLAPVNGANSTRPPLHLPIITPASAAEVAAFDPFNFELGSRRALEPPQSFLLDYHYVFTSTENTVQQLDILLRFSTEPAGAISVISFGLTNLFQDSIEVSHVSRFGPDSYLYLDGVGCIRIPEVNLLDGIEDFFIDFPDQYLLNGVLPQLVESDVMINGTLSDHYRAVAEDISQGDISVEEFTVELFIDQKSGHAVRLLMLAKNSMGSEGASSFLENPFVLGGGDISIAIDISGLDQPQDVAVPDICENAGLTLFPVVDDARIVDSSLNLTYYNTLKSGAEIIEFYRREMPLLGWEDSNPDKQFDFNEANLTIVFENATGQQTTVNIRTTPGVAGLVVIRSGDY